MSYECTQDAEALFLCTFGGEARTNCTVDADCPGNAAFCYVNTTWSAVPAQCACHVEYAFGGINCDQSTSQQAGWLWATSILFLIMGILALGVSVAAAVQLRVWHFNRENTHHTTVVLITLSSIVSIVFMSMHLARFTGNLPFEIQPDTGARLVPFALDVDMLFALWFVLTSFAALNVSVTWLFLSIIAESNSKDTARRYRRGILIYFALFTILIVALFIMREMTLVPIFCIPAVLYMVGVFLWGFFRFRRAIASSLALMKTGHDPKMELVLSKISTASLLMSITSMLIIVFLALHLLVFEDTPAFPAATFVLDLGYLAAQGLALSVAVYTFRFSKPMGASSSTAAARTAGAAAATAEYNKGIGCGDGGGDKTTNNNNSKQMVASTTTGGVDDKQDDASSVQY